MVAVASLAGRCALLNVDRSERRIPLLQEVRRFYRFFPVIGGRVRRSPTADAPREPIEGEPGVDIQCPIVN